MAGHQITNKNHFEFSKIKKDLSKKLDSHLESNSEVVASELIELLVSIFKIKAKETTLRAHQLSFSFHEIGWKIKTNDFIKAAKSSTRKSNLISAIKVLSQNELDDISSSVSKIVSSNLTRHKDLAAIETRSSRVISSGNKNHTITRREAGSYYTPEVVVDFMVQQTIEDQIKGKDEINLQNITCFDPAAGTGNFLIGAIKFLSKIVSKRNKISIERAQKLVAENCMFGADIDRNAINAAIERICRLTNANYSKVKGNFICADGLDHRKIRNHYSHIFGKNGGFQFILGNPPYVDYRKINSSTKSFLKDYTSVKGAGKVNLYIPFMEASLNYTTQSGKVGLIVPNQWLANNQGYPFRKMAIEHIEMLVDISNIRVFDDADTYPVIMIASKEPSATKDISISTVQDIGLLKRSEITYQQLPKSSVTESRDLKIKTSINNKLEKIWAQFASLPKLGDISEDFLWGTSQAGYGRKKVNAKNKKLHFQERKDLVKMLQTADIKKMNIQWQQDHLPKNIFSEAQLKRFKKKKIVIARLTKDIQCAFDDNGFALGKASFITHENEELLKALVIILSSTLISTWYRDNFTNVHMAGGYLRYDIPYLKQIPIPNLSSSDINRLSSQYDKLNKKFDQQYLDSIVLRAYGLSENENKVIAQSATKAA